MTTEIEAKFTNIDHKLLRKRLKAAGAECTHPMRLMKRAIFHTPELTNRFAYIRLRDEGDKTTLTYKQFDSMKLGGAREIEVEVNDFAKTIEFFSAIGLEHESFQESKRETWQLRGVQVELDIWPWLEPYVEIEGESETAIKRVTKQLGLKWGNALFGDVMVMYRQQYPHLNVNDTIGRLPSVRFSDPLPNMLRQK